MTWLIYTNFSLFELNESQLACLVKQFSSVLTLKFYLSALQFYYTVTGSLIYMNDHEHKLKFIFITIHNLTYKNQHFYIKSTVFLKNLGWTVIYFSLCS